MSLVRWSDGITTLAAMFHTVDLGLGLAGNEFLARVNPNSSDYRSATVTRSDTAVDLTLDADPPLSVNESISYAEGVDSTGEGIGVLVFRMETNPNDNWADAASIFLQNYIDSVAQVDNSLIRSLTGADIINMVQPAPKNEAEFVDKVSINAGWDIILDRFVDPVYGDGTSGTISARRELRPMPTAPYKSDKVGLTDDTDTTVDTSGDTAESTPPSVTPSVTEPAFFTYPPMPPQEDSGANNAAMIAAIVLIVFALLGMLAWRFRLYFWGALNSDDSDDDAEVDSENSPNPETGLGEPD